MAVVVRGIGDQTTEFAADANDVSTTVASVTPVVRKQMNAMPPNYIHSLDSTHMMLTALHCQHEHIPFAAVHDCYWTLAANVDRMGEVCREQFVALHRLDLLHILRDQLHDTYLRPIEQVHSCGFYCLIPLQGERPVHLTLNTPKPAIAIENVRKIYDSVPEPGTFNLDDVLKSRYFFS